MTPCAMSWCSSSAGDRRVPVTRQEAPVRGTMVRSVVVVPFDPAWASRAAELIARLRELLGATALRIDHIGSTAVVGMAAKDVLDIQVSVSDLEQATRVLDGPLREDGFVRLPFTHDHVPAGRRDDPRTGRSGFWRRRGHATGDANLHVRLAGSPNERVAVLFATGWSTAAFPSAERVGDEAIDRGRR
jgi:GrpB-like predicted nucleotidyltransferase (UPF0157 family)